MHKLAKDAWGEAAAEEKAEEEAKDEEKDKGEEATRTKRTCKTLTLALSRHHQGQAAAGEEEH